MLGDNAGLENLLAEFESLARRQPPLDSTKPVYSGRCKRLIEDLHEPFTNEQRWAIAQRFLDEEREEAIKQHLAYLVQQGIVRLEEHD